MRQSSCCKKKHGYVRSVDVANHLNFSRPSVSVAMANLRSLGLVTTDERGFLLLTPEGLAQAEKVLERHTLITCLLYTSSALISRVSASCAHLAAATREMCIRDSVQAHPQCAGKNGDKLLRALRMRIGLQPAPGINLDIKHLKAPPFLHGKEQIVAITPLICLDGADVADMHRLAPVSYTHLDVYKRQLQP